MQPAGPLSGAPPGLNPNAAPVTSPAVNDSGAPLNVGDIVIRGTAVDNSVVLTSAPGARAGVQAVVQGGNNGETILLAETGTFLVNVTGAVARGDYIESSGTPGVAAPQGLPFPVPGCFAVAVAEKVNPAPGLVLCRRYCQEGF